MAGSERPIAVRHPVVAVGDDSQSAVRRANCLGDQVLRSCGLDARGQLVAFIESPTECRQMKSRLLLLRFTAGKNHRRYGALPFELPREPTFGALMRYCKSNPPSFKKS